MASVGEGEGGMIWENDIETCIIPYKKRITSPGSMQDTGGSGIPLFYQQARSMMIVSSL